LGPEWSDPGSTHTRLFHWRHISWRTGQDREAQLGIHGRLRGTLTWTLEAEGNQTYASLDAAYQLVGGVLARALDALFVERAIQADVDQMLENMKRQLGTPNNYAVNRRLSSNSPGEFRSAGDK
jgi:hypothetical protein